VDRSAGRARVHARGLLVPRRARRLSRGRRRRRRALQPEPDSQREAAEELGLSYRLLSDEGMKAAEVLELPTFEFRGERYLRRVTLIVRDGTVKEALYPVFPPEDAARQALDSLGR